MKNSRIGLLLGSQNNWKFMTHCESFYLLMAIFFIPLSPTIKSFFIAFSVIGVFITPAYWKDFSYVLSKPWATASIVFFLVVLAACFWGAQDVDIKMVFIEKYSKLLMLPLFAIAFRDPDTRRKGINSFIFAMFITCILSIYKDTHNPGDDFKYAGGVFHNYIETGYMMAFAVYLLGLKMVRSKGSKQLIYLSALLLFSYQVLFISPGRTAQAAYFVLIIMLFIQHLPMKKLMLAVFAFSMLIAVIGYISTPISKGFVQIAIDLHHHQQGDYNSNSVGSRIQFHKTAKNLFMKHPLIGSGTGGFANKWDRDNTMPEWKDLLDPHSQYWLIAADSGLLGLMAFLAWYVCLFRAALQLHEMKPVLLGLLVSFLIVNLTDSLLFYSSAGYLFILVSALALGESIQERRCAHL